MRLPVWLLIADAAGPDWRRAGGVRIRDTDETGDEGCAAPEAYGVDFTLADAPGAVLTIWTYAVRGTHHGGVRPVRRPHGAYAVGFRYSYRAGQWALDRYAEEARWYGDAGDADDAARQVAELLAVADPDVIAGIEAQGVFGWEGVPW